MEHTSRAYDEELQTLTAKVQEMGALSVEFLRNSVAALLAGDGAAAENLVLSDRLLDESQRDVEDLGVQIIARRQPVADDLRLIVANMRMAGDLERIGDLAKNIAKRAAAINAPLATKTITAGLESLSQASLLQLSAVLKAFVARDGATARAIRQDDARIDGLYTAVFRELLTYMMEDPRNISQCTHLLFCAKNLERVGDHATNLAENIEYAVIGKMPGDERPKGETVLHVAGV